MVNPLAGLVCPITYRSGLYCPAPVRPGRDGSLSLAHFGGLLIWVKAVIVSRCSVLLAMALNLYSF